MESTCFSHPDCLDGSGGLWLSCPLSNQITFKQLASGRSLCLKTSPLMEKLPHVVRITVSVTVFVRFMKWNYLARTDPLVSVILLLNCLSSAVSDLSAQRDADVLGLLIRFSSPKKNMQNAACQGETDTPAALKS